jgi:hypothetical protein
MLAIVLAVATIGSFVLGVFVFWPRLTIDMVQSPDPLSWQYAVKNESLLFSFHNLAPKSNIVDMYLGGMHFERTATHITGTTIRLLRPGDEHTFDGTSFGGQPLAPRKGAKLSFSLTFRYLGIPVKRMKCFEYTTPLRGGMPRWTSWSCEGL